MSLKVALERLLGQPAYHMSEVFSRPDHVTVWRRAANGDLPVWSELFAGYGSVLDWPAAAFFAEIAAAFPDAPILLSTRADPQVWWLSARDTIFEILRRPPAPGLEAWHEMWDAVMSARFAADVQDEAVAIAAYQRHIEDVRETIPADRLFEWQPSDGWGPLCRALQLPLPDEPFPHVNTREQFRASHQGDPPST